MEDRCKRCGAVWIQRGDEVPKYCPTCHSSRWNSEKKTYTCPKCGRTRILRSNSRENLCPECDVYSERRAKSRHAAYRVPASGINPVIHLWRDGCGLTLIYIDNGGGIAALYDEGRMLGEINIEAWCKKSSLVFETGSKLGEERYQKIFESAVDRILFAREILYRKSANIRSLRGVSLEQADVINLHESGVKPVSIALELGLPFSTVMGLLSEIPPMRAENDPFRRRIDEKKSEELPFPVGERENA